MQVLVTNDDGIQAGGLWALAGELKKFADVTVVAPDGERSAVGTAVTLRRPLQVRPVKPPVSGVAASSVDGTPSDSVILALGKLMAGRVDLVVSGINHGPNLGEDVHISGTVGAALQGYLRGFSAVAVSAPAVMPHGLRPGADMQHHVTDESMAAAARTAALVIKRLGENPPPRRILLNINLPPLPLSEIAGARITRLARESHINTVEEGNHGRGKYYWLERERLDGAAVEGTDIWAVTHGLISITPLYFNRDDKPPQAYLEALCAGLLEELRRG
jgi:5'-nucleotidase